LAVLAPIFVLALAFLIFTPTNVGLTPGGRYILTVFIIAVSLWATMPGQHLPTVSFIVVFLVILSLAVDLNTRAQSLSTGMSGYADPNLWLLILGFVFAAAFERSGLARRIALTLMNLARGSTLGILFMVGLINILLAPTTPSTIAKGGLLLPIILGLVAASGVKKGESNFARGISIYAGAADNMISAGILTATISNPLAISILASAAKIQIGWSEWLVYTFPMALISTLVAFPLLYLLFKPEMATTAGGHEYIKKQLKALGRTTSAEWKTLGAFFLALGLWALDPTILGDAVYRSLPPLLQAIIGLHAFVKGLIPAAFLLMPRVGVVSWREAEQTVPWGTYVLFGAALGLSAGLVLTKGLDWAMRIGVTASGISTLPFLGIFVIMVLVMYYAHTLFFTYTAMGAVTLPVVISLATTLGFPVLSLYIPAMTLVPFSLIFPFNTVPLLMFSGAGLFETKHSVRFGVLFGLVVLALWVVIGIPYWKALGVIP
jgi:anion transporter